MESRFHCDLRERFRIVLRIDPYVRFCTYEIFQWSEAVVNHIRVRRMWKYVHMKAELTLDELAHMAECELCLKLFRICVLAQAPALIDLEDDAQRNKAS